MIGEGNLEKTWLVEGVGFEEAEPIVLEVMEDGARGSATAMMIARRGDEWLVRLVGYGDGDCVDSIGLILY